MKRIFILLSIIYQVGAAVDKQEKQSYLTLNDQIIISLLNNSRNIEQLNENISKIRALSTQKRDIVDKNGLLIISSYLKNKFGDQFDVSNFDIAISNKENKSDIYIKYIEPLIFIAKNLKLSELNNLLMRIGIDTNINMDALYNNYDMDILSRKSKYNEESKEKFIRLLKLGFANVIPKEISLLRLAIINRDTDLLKLLIKFDVDVNRKTTENHTSALMDAASIGNVDLVKLLIDAGANISDKTFGSNAMSFAKKKGRTEVIKLLKDAKKLDKKKYSDKKDNCAIM